MIRFSTVKRVFCGKGEIPLKPESANPKGRERTTLSAFYRRLRLTATSNRRLNRRFSTSEGEQRARTAQDNHRLTACSLPLWSLSLAISICVMLLFVGLHLNAVVPEATMEESDAPGMEDKAELPPLKADVEESTHFRPLSDALSAIRELGTTDVSRLYRNDNRAFKSRLREVYPTCKVMFFWGTARIEGLSVVEGARIDAFAPDVVINDGCIGTFTVWYPGYYGALAVYGDDPTTPEKDGAAEGDPITFTITRTENGKTSVAYPVTSSNPTFRNFSFQRVDLCAD